MIFSVVSLLAFFLLLPASYGRGQHQDPPVSSPGDRSSLQFPPPTTKRLAVGGIGINPCHRHRKRRRRTHLRKSHLFRCRRRSLPEKCSNNKVKPGKMPLLARSSIPLRKITSSTSE